MPRRPLNAMDRHIGRRIRQRRETLGLTLCQFADELDVSYQQLQKYEAGTNKLAASLLAEIAYKLQMPTSWFFEITGREE